MAPRQTRWGSRSQSARRAALVAAAALLLVAACAVSGALATSPGGATPQPAAGAVTARADIPLDFARVLQLVANLRAHPPDKPLVCILGGSSARECTVSNDSWSDQVSRGLGSRVLAVNLGSKHRLFAQDVRLARLLPDGPSLVFIGVNVGRFCNGPYDPPVVLPEPTGSAARTSPLGSTVMQPDWRKRQIAEQWMVKRWPHFRARFRYNLRVLAQIVRECKARGQHPVIIDLPRNMQIIGRLLDRPMDMYHDGCRALARRYGIPYVQFQWRTGLTNRDFSDLWHTVDTGKVKWQKQLSATTVHLLRKYGIPAEPTPSPSPAASAASR